VNEPLPTIDGGFRVILCDPPWNFKTYNDNISAKSAASHYALMSMADLRRLPIADLAAKDCALIMWATQAQLHDAIDLMRIWGFAYKTAGAWAKQSSTGQKWAFGTGYILRSAAEFYLVGTRGKPKAKVKNVRNLIVAPTRGHSRKPDQMHADLERLFDGPRLELFARQSRPGWTVWGHESAKFDKEAA
jgi:N6-adenosine-specific RNA methylase IME4